MKIKSTAKINLYLNITGKDESDGYHYIDSLFQEIDLFDEVEIKKIKSEKDEILFENIDISGETTVHSALRLFKEKFKKNDSFSIHVKKHIPAGAGLGGGSSNAAFVLMALSKVYNIPVSELLEIGYSVGSDVSFFFYGGLCRVQGKGEIVTPLIQNLKDICFIIVYPNILISTGWAYSLLDDSVNEGKLEDFSKNSYTGIDFLRKIVYNKFQFFVFKHNVVLSGIKIELGKVLKSRLSFMSGSGSSLVFVYDNRVTAEMDLDFLQRNYDYKSFFCVPIYR